MNQADGAQALPVIATGDMTSCEQIRQLLARCRKVVRDGHRTLVLDLRSVAAADTKLAACLVVIYQTACRASVRVELLVSKPVRDVIELCRLGWLLEKTAAAN